MSAAEKWELLLRSLRQDAAAGMLLAFSGGVDSALLLCAAVRAHITPLLPLFLSHELSADEDLAYARRVAAELGVELYEYQLSVLEVPQVRANRRDRCYFCKHSMFGKLLELGRERGISYAADGVNADDLRVYRPGQRAAAELGVAHPLAAAGLSKAEIRQLAREQGLSVSDRPSAPCLATRFPYDTQLEAAQLARTEQAESALHALGFAELRLRVHGDVARLELPPSQLAAAVEQRQEICRLLRAGGFEYLTLDLEGLSSGRFDQAAQRREEQQTSAQEGNLA